MSYGDTGNKDMFSRYDVETNDGLFSTSRMDQLASMEKDYRNMGVENICPHCSKPCAMFFGDPDGDHWCLACQILADIEGQR